MIFNRSFLVFKCSIACLLASSALAYCQANIPPSLGGMTMTDKVTSVHGSCDTPLGYTYQVLYRPDGSYQTRDMGGSLIDSGTYTYTVDATGDRAIIDYITFSPGLGNAPPVQWHETAYFTTSSSGNLDGTQVSGGNCTYSANYTLAPTTP
jgi:hypothetical protein